MSMLMPDNLTIYRHAQIPAPSSPVPVNKNLNHFYPAPIISAWRWEQLWPLINELLRQLYHDPAGPRDDRQLTGGWRNDQLIGGSGNDTLRGYGGNDYLSGGDGNDYLDGGRGNDVLIGGNGQDYVEASTGYDEIKGGAGIDTISLPGALSDYAVKYTPERFDNPPNPLMGRPSFLVPESFEFVDRTNQIHSTISEIEKFTFHNGEHLTAAQVRERVNQPPERLAIPPAQRERLMELFVFSRGADVYATVFDSNQDQRLSAGDTAVFTGGFTGREILSHKLTATDIQYIQQTSNDAQVLAENRSKWEATGMSEYQYRVQRSCFCIGDVLRPVDLTVRNNEITDARYADTGERLPPDARTNMLTVNDLFNLIEDAIQREADRIDMKYDEATGYPREMYIDYSQQMADEELSISASNLHPMLYPAPPVHTYPTRDVIGFGNRMPAIVPPGQAQLPRDYVLLGKVSSYPAPPVTITVDGQTSKVLRENGDYVARGLNFPQEGRIEGYLTLADQSRVPLNITVQFAY